MTRILRRPAAGSNMSIRVLEPIEKVAEVLIVTGPPGAGKSTVADALAKSFSFPCVHLHSDDFWGAIKRGLIAPYLPEAHAQNRVVMDALAAAARCYARGGYFVVFDGVVGPWFLGRMRDLIDVPLHYVVLRPDLCTTVARAQERTDRLREFGPIQNLHQQFANLGTLESHVIDTTGQSIAATVEAVRRGFSSGAFRLPDNDSVASLS
jgi:chloramphenicol 3-O-phosphotransferase